LEGWSPEISILNIAANIADVRIVYYGAERPDYVL
jgi:hypothetical protein